MSSGNQNQLKDKFDVHYFKLPYIGNISHHIKNKLSKLCKEFCKVNFSIKLAFNSFKIKNCFPYKDPIPNEHIKKDNKSHISKHLQSSERCFDSYNSLCFKIIDKTNSKFDLKIKEALHVNWRKPNLNAQQNHLALTLSL